MGWLIAYDISCPKRWRKVYALVTEVGIPVQYSLFYTDLSAREFRALWSALAAVIDPHADDVRAYPFARDSPAWLGGRSAPPGGVALYGDAFLRHLEGGRSAVAEECHDHRGEDWGWD